MDEKTGSSIPVDEAGETGPSSIEPVAVTEDTILSTIVERAYAARVIPEGTWQPTETKDGWTRTIDGVTTVVASKDLAAWEKATQRGLDGKDRFRGIKQKLRLDMYVAERMGIVVGVDLASTASADATGMP